MNQPKIPEIISLSKDSPDELFSQVEEQFLKMYQHMDNMGLHLKLVEDGEKLWIESIRKSLGRLNELIVAKDGDTILAFGAATIRFTPSYLGNKKIGYLTHLYLEPTLRQAGLGTAMMLKMEEWCRLQNVDSIETERLCGNETVVKLHDKLGYVAEQTKLRKVLA